MKYESITNYFLVKQNKKLNRYLINEESEKEQQLAIKSDQVVFTEKT